jgi:hypothetical protein
MYRYKINEKDLTQHEDKTRAVSNLQLIATLQ